ncbi:MAG: alkaline phosphatase family protein, partial [Acetobacteraceae bacterium]|nr:alkaline phosphatase family protein [Acetobacteraceae bacterium]
LVVIFNENNSFDHYFGTYPVAANPPGQPTFVAAANTPSINGLTPALLKNNPNSVQPFRLDRTQAGLNCDNSNAYAAEQLAFNNGLANKFPENTGAAASGASGNLAACPFGVVMGYYDGNTVTALWNYAQQYAMSDSFFDTEYGTTVMGHLNLVSGQTHQTYAPGNVQKTGAKNFVIRNGSVIANLDSALDDCKGTPINGQAVASVQMTGANVGDLLNAKGISWGWFYGDFTAQPGSTPTQAVCATGYDVHYDPFQYYSRTANPHHLPPSSIAMVGLQGDQANHQYDLTTFTAALQAGRLPAVTFLKAPSTATGHPQTSDALTEQSFLVNTINMLQMSPEWNEMAIIVTYDDSDGWYDHVVPAIVNQSNDSTVDSMCGNVTLPTGAFNDRCGYGMRMPFLVISPYAKTNYVDHTTIDTTSVLRFIEDNWSLGRIDSLDHPNGTPPGQASFDQVAGSILGHFNFSNFANATFNRVILDPSAGTVSAVLPPMWIR